CRNPRLRFGLVWQDISAAVYWSPTTLPARGGERLQPLARKSSSPGSADTGDGNAARSEERARSPRKGCPPRVRGRECHFLMHDPGASYSPCNASAYGSPSTPSLSVAWAKSV